MFRFFDLFALALERLWQHRVLVFWALVGLATATTLALSLPLYVDAVNTDLLVSRLEDPPYAFRFRYIGSWEGNITRDDVTAASATVNDRFGSAVGLPVQRSVSFVRGAPLTLLYEDNRPLGTFSPGTLSGAEEQIAIVSGEWPLPAPTADDDPIPALLPETMLYTVGLQVGDTLSIARPGEDPLPVRVAALWAAVNPADPTWIFPTKFFDEIFLVQPDDLWRVTGDNPLPVEEAAWYLLFDGQSVRTADVESLIGRISDGERAVSGALPGVQMDLSPVNGLKAFNDDVTQLTQQLTVILLPVVGLIFYFVALVSDLLASRQMNEDVTLRSRGMTRRAILSLHLLMWLLLAGFALGIGLAAAPSVVRLVARTTSFLSFDHDTGPLDITFTRQSVIAGAVVSLVAVFRSVLYMAGRISRQTITRFKQTSARASKAWWHRWHLDLLLLIPAIYVLYTLRQQGGLVTSAEDPFSDPAIFLAPTLFSLGFTLLFLRLWPVLLRSGAWLLNYDRGIVLLMALRELTRSVGRYRGTLIMMCFTLSLIGFTASMASTIDRSLEDAVYYKNGADVVLISAADAQTEENTEDNTITVTGYTTLPASDLLDVSGVRQVSRVGRYQGRLVLPNQRIDGFILGIDRADLAPVTFFRSDYAAEPLADMLNKLAGNRTGVLLSTETAVDYNLRIGEEITVQVFALDTWYDMTVPIVGVLDYFPTLNPNAGFFMITNIDAIFETVGTELPHNYWLRLGSDVDRAAVRDQIRQIGFPVLEWRDAEVALETAQTAPARRGVLGFLSVGFVASIVLTLVGAIIQTAASFRAQTVQLGSLRAMGLGGKSVAIYLILSQGMVAGSGILGGTLIGMGTTLLFLPLLDFSNGLPPYLVRVAWGEIILVYGVFAAILFGITFLTALLLGRQRLITVVKLGDV